VALEIALLDAPFGARVYGLDPRAELSEGDRESLREALRRRHLLLLRGESVSERDQIRFAEIFGPVADESIDGSGGASYVSNTRADGFARSGELYFHSDLAFTPDPLELITMCALELPASGTSTRFADAMRAAATLPAALRERCRGLRARHLFDLVSQRQDLRYRLEDFPGAAQAEHPLLLPHHQTGEPILFVSQMQTDRLLGLPGSEAESLLRELLAHLYRPEHLYEHCWQEEDLLVWDNWALQHARPTFDGTQPRTLRRVVAGRTIVKAYEHRPGMEQSALHR